MSLAPTGGFPTPGPPRQSSIYFCCCCCSVTQLCLTLYDLMVCSTPGFPVLYHLQSLLKLMSIESVMLSNHFILCHPLLLLPSIFPSFRGFSSELTLHIRWPKYWSFSLSISPSNEYSGLTSYRIDLLAVQRNTGKKECIQGIFWT